MPHRARPAVILAAIAVLPFVWSVATQIAPGLADFGLRFMGPRFLGPYLALGYGGMMLAALSGVLFGLVLRVERPGWLPLALIIPALWAFLFTGGGPVPAALWLGAGYLVALALDWLVWQRGLAPVWWFPLRAAQTAVILPCLIVTAFA